MLTHPIPPPAGCHLLGRLLARVRLWWQLRRRVRIPLSDYEDGLAQLENLADAANCNCPEEVRDRKAREATDVYRRAAIDRVWRGGGSDE